MGCKKAIKHDELGATLVIGPELKHYGVKGMRWGKKKASKSDEDSAGGGYSDPDDEEDDEDEEDEESTLPSERYRVLADKRKRPVGREKTVGSGKATIHKREKANTGKAESSKFSSKRKRPVGREKTVGSGKATIHKREKANTGSPETSKRKSKWR